MLNPTDDKIFGNQFANAFVFGANNLIIHKSEIDALNVFPVPDGDTGTNMSLTAKAAVPEVIAASENAGVGQTASIIASAMLRGARGNSGVILSLIFRGIATSLSGKDSVTSKEFAEAFSNGAANAFKSVMKPVEGTILTVSRDSAKAYKEVSENSPQNFLLNFKAFLDAAKKSLEETKEILPALKKAGVVDAGGAGIVALLEGMYAFFSGKEINIDSFEKNTNNIQNLDIEDSEKEITFSYCTEFIIIKSLESKILSVDLLRAYLETIGDSVVVVEDETDGIIKIHAHTNHPGNAIEEGIKFGSLINIKIDNMKEQARQKKSVGVVSKSKAPPASPDNEYGFAVVSSGAGLDALFLDLGANAIIKGGQTNNPSTEDILEAVLSVPSKNVFVLPNNKNIIMAAEQVCTLVKDRKVFVLQTRNTPEGISALMAFNPELTPLENAVSMTASFEKISAGSVTYAAKDSAFDNKKIHKGDIIGLSGGKIVAVGNDIQKTLLKTVKKVIKNGTKFVTLFYGADISPDEATETAEFINSKTNSDIEVVSVNGGQSVYYYLISAE